MTARARFAGLLRRVTGRGGPGGIILLYHRIAPRGVDPWALAVTPEEFDAQLQILRQFGTPMGLREFQRKRNHKGFRDRAVVVTFDDGYANNLTEAKPLLARHGVPATVFVTAGMIDRPREFWWDELDRLLLQPGTLPKTLTWSFGGAAQAWTLGQTATYTEAEALAHRGWRAWDAECPTARHTLYRALYEQLFPLDDAARREHLDRLVEWAGCSPIGRDTHRLLRSEEVRMLAADGLVEIGGHSVSHASLGALRPRRQWQEIADGKRCLDDLLGAPVTSFAFPFGRPSDYTRETIALVRAAGFTVACTTTAAPVRRRTDSFELPRWTVQAGEGAHFEQWMHTISHD